MDSVYNILNDDLGSDKDVVSISMSGMRGTASCEDTKGVQIDVSGMNYSVKIGKGKDAHVRDLLVDVDLNVEKGELVALMGPSGAGKSTLLDVIANRKREGMWSGQLLINKQPHSDTFARECAYVLQDDVHIPVLTVRETIEYACWVKMPEGTTVGARNARVSELIKMMSLGKVENSQVGDKEEFRGISGGQMKRLSIAVEIAHLPELIFLDEPTSGLDSSISLEVMTVVKNLANQGRTCMSTIHQPSPEVFALFNRCVLVSAGRVVYNGPADEILDYFQRPELNYIIRADEKDTINSAEYALEICGGTRYPDGENKPRQAPELAKTFRASDFYKKPAAADNFEAPPSKHASSYATSPKTQSLMLLSRGWKSKIRDVKDLKAQLIKVTGVGILIGGTMFGVAGVEEPLFDNRGVPKSDTTNCTSLIFMVMMYNLMNNQQAISKLCYMQTIYRREMRSNSYSTGPYWIHAVLCELPIIIGGHCIATTLFFLLNDFGPAFDYYCFFWFILLLTNLNSYFMTQIIAAVTQNSALAFAVFPLAFIFLNRFSGFGLAVDDVPPLWEWAPWICYSRWSYQSLIINHFEDIEGGNLVIESFGFDGYSKEYSVWILFLNMGFFLVLLYVALLEQKSKLEKVLSNSSSMSLVTAPASGKGALRETLINNENDGFTKKSDYDVLPGKSTYTVDWFRANTGEVQLSRGCKVMFRDVCYAVPKAKKDAFPLIAAIKKKFSGGGDGYEAMGDGPSSSGGPLPGETPILRGVTGRAQPGEMVALMGASGAGKSTLLDILAGRKNSGTISGDLLFNGQPCFMTTPQELGDEESEVPSPAKLMQQHGGRSLAATVTAQSQGFLATRYAYVMQDNVHIGELTVRETLTFAAQLRLDQRLFNPTSLEKRIQKILDMLGLDEHADTVVGNHDIRGISGGQLKRVSIAVEIINMPELIFLDEPTTGLDSNISYEVMAAVRNLANQNRTVIATIHQPSPDTFALFDKVLVLAEGRVIYFGPRRDCVTFFTGSPYEFSYFGNNPADFVVAIAGGFVAPGNPSQVKDKSKGTGVPGEELADYYSGSAFSRNFRENVKTVILTDLAQTAASSPQRGGSGVDRQSTHFQTFQSAVYSGSSTANTGFSLSIDDKLYANTLPTQLKTLLARAALVMRKRRKQQVAVIVRNLVIGLFFGSIYYQLETGTDSTVYTNRFALFFFTLIFMMLSMQEALPAVFEARLLYYRERGSRAYHVLPYWVSTWLYKLPVLAMGNLTYCLCVYNLSGLNDDSGRFSSMYWTVLLFTFTSLFTTQTVAHLNGSQAAAIQYLPVYLFFNVMFAGFIIYIPSVQDWLSWGPEIMPMRYAFQSLVRNELDGNNDLPNRDDYLGEMGFDELTSAECISIQLMWLLVAVALSLVVLSKVDHEQR